MKKFFIFLVILLVIIISIIIVFHTQQNNENSSFMAGGLIGEIVEIYDDGSYRVTVRKEDSNFSKEDDVLVKYNTIDNDYMIGENIDIVYSKYSKMNNEYIIYAYSINKVDDVLT